MSEASHLSHKPKPVYAITTYQSRKRHHKRSPLDILKRTKGRAWVDYFQIRLMVSGNSSDEESNWSDFWCFSLTCRLGRVVFSDRPYYVRGSCVNSQNVGLVAAGPNKGRLFPRWHRNPSIKPWNVPRPL